MKTVIAERVIHRGSDRVTLRFPYDAELINITREQYDARWSKQMNCWHIPDSSDIITLLLKAFYGKAYVDYAALKPGLAEKTESKEGEEKRKITVKTRGLADAEFSPLSDKGREDIDMYKRWMETNRYPASTVQTYTAMMVKFLRFVSPREAGQCTADDLISIVEQYVLPNGFSQSFQNQLISSVKKFYSHIYRKTIDPGSITRPRPRHNLPNVLSKDEVKKILSVTANEKHRVMLSLIYACGLRRSELIQMIPGDIEKSRGLLRIRQAKGFKDRIVPISEKTIEMIDNYLVHYRPERYLFEGQRAGEQYSPTSLEKVLKNACAKAGIRKPVTLHWLRHSYATHLLESGTDLRYIQELLGHKSSKTTEIYTHVTTRGIQNIRSPFDDL